MRRFVAALFACCAPRRAPSTASFGDGDIADPRDIDEGSCISSSSDGTIDPREMFGVDDDESGDLSRDGSASGGVHEVDGGSGKSRDPEFSHQTGKNGDFNLRHSRESSSLDKLAVNCASESGSCKSAKLENCSIKSSGTKSMEHDVNGIETDNSDNCQQIGIVGSDTHVSLEGSQPSNHNEKLKSTSGSGGSSADESKREQAEDSAGQEDIELNLSVDQLSKSEKTNDEPPSEDDKTFSYDYSYLENDVTSTISAEKPSVNLSTDTDAVKDLISGKSDLQTSTNTKPAENTLQNGLDAHPKQVDEAEGQQAEKVPEIRLSGYVSSTSSDSEMSSDTDLEDDFLFSKAQPPEVKVITYSLLGIIGSNSLIALAA